MSEIKNETTVRTGTRQVEFVSALDAKAPSGPIEQRWDKHRFEMKLVNPANRRKYTIIVVGSGLAGASAAATLGEAGYNVLCFCYQDSPRRAHSIAAQGGINAAKNYRNDGDSIYRLFYDTVKEWRLPRPRAMSIALRRSRSISLTSASPKACRSPASTAVCSITVRSAARKWPAPSTPAARPGSNCCSAPIRPLAARLPPARSRCSHAPRCSISSWLMAARAGLSPVI